LLLFAGALRAAEPQGKLVKELWDAAYLEGAKVGYFRTSVHEVERDGQKLLRTTVELNLTVKRFNALANLRMESGTEETADGKVRGVFMRQFFDGGKQLVLAGTVAGDTLHVKVDNGRIERKIRWNDQVLGLQKQERLFAENRAKPGDRFTYQSFEPQLNAVVTLRAVVKDFEEVDVLRPRKDGKGQVDRLKEKLLRVEVTPEKIETSQGAIQLPGMVSWLDRELLPVRSQMEMPGLGPVTFYRSTREVATAPGGALPQVADLGLATLIPVKTEIRRPYDTRSAVYRITVKGDEQVASAFAEDDRQQVKKVEGSTVELAVRALREPRKVDRPQEPKAEFLESCYYLKSDDPEVRRLAREAVGDEADPWKKAQRIERFVHNKMRLNNGTAFCPADQVARELQGDCRQHAMLAAAVCRAAGVPSRTAVGLVYVTDRQRGPVFGFHMWTEVFVQGQWLGIDATLGQGSVGAAHIKIADSSWHGVESLTPLLPVARVLGKMTIEVVSVE
jgi:hypothetical protein